MNFAHLAYCIQVPADLLEQAKVAAQAALEEMDAD